MVSHNAMKIGLMNNPALSLYEQIEAFGKAGYDFLDLTIEGPALTFDPQKVRDLLDQYGLSVVGHTDPCLPWAYPVETVRKACFKELERCAELFSAIGARVMNIHPCYVSPPRMKQTLIDQNVAALRPLSAMARDLGLVLVLENFKRPFDLVSTFKICIQEAPGLQVHLDVGHTNMGGDTAEDFCRHLGHDIAHVHLSDNRATDDHHMPIGVGNVDWPRAISALKKTGYDGTITLEVFCGTNDILFSYLEISRRFVTELWMKHSGTGGSHGTHQSHGERSSRKHGQENG